MKRYRRTLLFVTAAMCAALTTLAGCSNSERPSSRPTPEGYGYTPPSAAGAPKEPSGPGVTRISDIYGSACGRLPASGPGSVTAMAGEPLGTAVRDNPLLSTLARAIQTAGLEGQLNDAHASYTLLAPSNVAFDKLPPSQLAGLLADKKRLTQVLDYHLIPARYNAAGLAATPLVPTAEGSQLGVSGQQGDLSFDLKQRASTQCANIPTTNATVFIIDQVLMPHSS